MFYVQTILYCCRRNRRNIPNTGLAGVHFVQMQLKDDAATGSRRQETELVYSPVLVWKPGKQTLPRHSSPHPPPCTPVHFPVISEHGPEASCTRVHTATGSRPPVYKSSLSRSEVSARKSPLHMATTDLTLSLPFPNEERPALLVDQSGVSYNIVTMAISKVGFICN